MSEEKIKGKLRSFIPERLKVYLYKKTKSRAFFSLYGVAFKELLASFPQFFTWRYPISSFFRSLKYIFHALSRIFLGRSIKLSYSFQGEDRNIEALLKPIINQDGFYVDVGCNEPRFISNTFLFYRRGWRGICIDANEKLITKYKKTRPRDKAVCALLSDKHEVIEFFEYTNNVLSSVKKEYVEGYLNEGQEIISRKVRPTRTLTEILDELKAPSYFDLLSGDIEGSDFLAIKSLDFDKYTPKLIVVEADFDPSNPQANPFYVHLKKRGYILKGYILTNLYFLKD